MRRSLTSDMSFHPHLATGLGSLHWSRRTRHWPHHWSAWRPPSLGRVDGDPSRLARASSQWKKRHERVVLDHLRGEGGGPRGLARGDGNHVGGDEAERREVRVGAQRSVRFGTRSVKSKSTKLDGHSPSPRGRRLKRRIGTGNVISHVRIPLQVDSAARTSCPAHAALRHPTATRAVNRHAEDNPSEIGAPTARL